MHEQQEIEEWWQKIQPTTRITEETTNPKQQNDNKKPSQRKRDNQTNHSKMEDISAHNNNYGKEPKTTTKRSQRHKQVIMGPNTIKNAWLDEEEITKRTENNHNKPKENRLRCVGPQHDGEDNTVNLNGLRRDMITDNNHCN